MSNESFAPQPMQPPQYGGQPPAGVPQKDRSSGRAGIILGIIGIVLAFIPVVLYVGFFLGAAALVIGIVALRRKSGGGLAPVILGGVAIVVASMFAGVYSGGSNSSAAPDQTVATHSAKAAEADDDSSTSAASAAPAVPASEEPSETPTPTTPPAPVLTAAQSQSVLAARGYLDSGIGFSAQGLLDQLTSSYGNGFAAADAQFAEDTLAPDWNAQAVKAAKGYLSSGMGFSHASLVDQLSSAYGNKFTAEQAEYAATQVGL